MQQPTRARETLDPSTEALGSFHGSPEPRAPPSALQAALAYSRFMSPFYPQAADFEVL